LTDDDLATVLTQILLVDRTHSAHPDYAGELIRRIIHTTRNPVAEITPVEGVQSSYSQEERVGKYRRYALTTPEPAPVIVEPAIMEPEPAIMEPAPEPANVAPFGIAQLKLDADTRAIVEAAIAHSGMTLLEFVQKSVATYATIVMGKARMSNDDLSVVSTTELLTNRIYSTHPNRAGELVRRAIYALERHNNSCKEKSQKWHINQTALQTLTGSNAGAIKELLKDFQQRLDAHNKKHKLSPYDNRKPGTNIASAIDLATTLDF